MDKLTVDLNGYVWIDNLKVFRLTPWHLIEFYDRDRRRSEKRGSCFVYITPKDLHKLLEMYTEG